MLYKLLKSLFCPHKTHNEGAEAPASHGSRLVANKSRKHSLNGWQALR